MHILSTIVNPALKKKSSREPNLKIAFPNSGDINVLHIRGVRDEHQPRKAMICLPGNGMSASDVVQEFESHQLVTTADKYAIGYAKGNTINEHLLTHIKPGAYNDVTLQLAMFKEVFMHLIKQEGMAAEDITIYGHSLGGFFAMKLAAELFDEGFAPKVFCSRSLANVTLVARYAKPLPSIFKASAASAAPFVDWFSDWGGDVVKPLIDKGYPAGRLFVYAAEFDDVIPKKASQLYALRQLEKFPQNFGHLVVNTYPIYEAEHNTLMANLKLKKSDLSESLDFVKEGETDIPSVLNGFVTTPVEKLEALAQTQLETQKKKKVSSFLSCSSSLTSSLKRTNDSNSTSTCNIL